MFRPSPGNRFQITNYVNPSGNRVFRVTGRLADGTRIRKNFTNQLDAIQAKHDYEMQAASEKEVRRAVRTVLTESEIADAEAAIHQAGGLKLSRIVAHYLTLRERVRKKGIDIDRAITFVETYFREEITEITVHNAVTEFLKSRAGISKKTESNYSHSLMLLVKSDPNKPLHDFTVTDLETEIGRYENLNSRRTVRRVFSVFFNWAMRHHYIPENPCDRLDRLPKDTSKIVILSLDEVKRLLHAAMTYRDGVAAASIAISLFAGLRPSELAELQAEDIRETTIIVRGGKRRRDGNRRVPIPEVLKLWLKEFPFQGRPDGWDYKMDVLKDATKAKHWVQDILRHTSISFQAERDKNAGLTESNNGTSRMMMERHYVSFIDDDSLVSKFWDLTPASIRKLKLKAELPVEKGRGWPSDEDLKKLVWSKPMMHAAAELGVSDVALKKRCVKLGIPLPKRGHWLKQ